MSATFNLHRPSLDRIRVDILKRSTNAAVLQIFNAAETVSATVFFDNIDELHDFATKVLVLVDEKRNEFYSQRKVEVKV